MLCPEVSSFQAPASRFKTEKVEQNHCADKISGLYFNHLVSIVLPDTLQVPPSVPEALVKDCGYYKIKDLDVSELVQVDFVNSFVKAGDANILSINRLIDLDDCMCVVPSGKLILSLNKDTYQSLGCEGVLSHFHQRTKAKYLVTIDLKTLSRKTRDKLKKSLGKLPRVSVLLNWRPHEESICPSSVAKYFADLNYHVKYCAPAFEICTRYSVKAPRLDFEEATAEECHDFVEWLGVLCLDADADQDEYLNSYEAPEPRVEFGQVKVLEARGFYCSKKLAQIAAKLVEVVEETKVPWVSMYTQGFSDSPVNFRENEHHYYSNGDYSHTLLLNALKQCVVCTQSVSNKMYH